MREFAVRLKKGDDLKASIEDICVKEGFDTAIILCGVGCVDHVHIRLAKAVQELDVDEDFEIISLIGTISKGKAHIHIGLSDEIGNSIGGHLMEGTIINTTCELVLGILEDYKSVREFDINTGYDEIIFKKEG